MNAERHPSLRSFVLVGLQVLISAAVVLATRNPWGHLIAVAVAVCGALLGLWAVISIGVRRVSILPELRHNAELVTAGPYRWVRHPMYAALLLFIGGLAFSPLAFWKVIAWSVLVIVLFAKSATEERELNEKFANYREYSRRTKRLIPYLL
jgi:protein-S-isoprenylcysteine O-methyltransferase Ste14